MNITAISDRIQTIQARIDTIAGAPAIPPAQPPSAVAPAAPASFAGALRSAWPAAGMDPDGSPVRPLDAAGGGGAATGAARYAPEIDAAATRYGIDPKLVSAVMTVESGGDPRATSGAGAMGLMQLMPANAAEAGLSDPYDPAGNIDAGARQLAGLLKQFGGDLDLALAGYNAGPNAVKRFGGVPPYAETQGYVRKVRALLDGSGAR